MIKSNKKNLDKKIARLKKLPSLYTKMMRGYMAKDAILMINNFQKGLKNQKLGLRRLHDFSVQTKSEKGYSIPDSPLYGVGEDSRYSLYNGLRIREKRNGFQVYPIDQPHNEAVGFTVKELFKLHEKGVTLHVTPKMKAYLHWRGFHLKPTTNILRIPPRPAFSKAYAITKTEINMNERSRAREIKKVMKDYIEKGLAIGINRIAGYVFHVRKYKE